MTLYSFTYSFSNYDPVHCFMSTSNCCFLTCIQISHEGGQVVWYSHLFQNFPQFTVIHTVKGFGIVNEAEVDVFLEFLCIFNDLMDVGNLISGSSASWKPNVYIWKFLVCILLNPSLKIFEYYLASMWNESNCMVPRIFFDIAFLWVWIPVLWPLLSIPNLLTYWEQNFNSTISGF